MAEQHGDPLAGGLRGRTAAEARMRAKSGRRIPLSPTFSKQGIGKIKVSSQNLKPKASRVYRHRFLRSISRCQRKSVRLSEFCLSLAEPKGGEEGRR